MSKISKRLSAAAQFVRSGAIVADIGTDHGYLPIFLAEQGKITKAIAADINVGPLNSAKENIRKNNLENIIDTYLTDGLNGIEKYAPTDVVICGMGGELIARIIEDAPFVKDSEIRLVLQPMTMIKELREYLKNGFLTIAEDIVFEDGKLYQIICAEYDGKHHDLTPAQLEIGAKNIENGRELFGKLLYSTVAKKEKIKNGLRLGGKDSAEVDALLDELYSIKEKYESAGDEI